MSLILTVIKNRMSELDQTLPRLRGQAPKPAPKKTLLAQTTQNIY